MEDKLTRKLNINKEDLKIVKAQPSSRVFAKMLDGFIEVAFLVILVIIFIDSFNINDVESNSTLLTVIIIVSQVFSLCINLIIPTLTKGQTIGKMALKIRIIHIDGNQANILIYLVRQSFFSIIALLGQITFLMEIANGILLIIYFICFVGLLTEELGRTLQDYFAKTIVVDDQNYKTYRKKRFHEIDNPLPVFDESSILESDKQDNAPIIEKDTINQSI